MDDRGLYHAADAMRSLYDMGDAPSLPYLRGDHGPQRQLLPLHELREHQRLQLIVGIAPGRSRKR